MGTAVAQWLRCCATYQKVAGLIPAGVNGFFIDIKSFRLHYGSGVDSASNRNEYQEYFLGVKSGQRIRLTTLPPFCAVVTKSGRLNFLEPSGPVMGMLYLLGVFNMSTPQKKNYCSFGKQHFKPSSLFEVENSTTHGQRFTHAWRERQIPKSNNPRTKL